MKCNLCDASADFRSRSTAAQHGWRFIEVETPAGFKYGCYCPIETKPRILDAVKKLLDVEKKK